MTSARAEGAFLHLEGVRLPIGPRGRVVLDHATVALAGRRRADLPEVRLHAFEGSLTFGSDDGGDLLRADVRFTAVPDPDERAWIAGDLAITRATWAARGDGAPPRGPMRGSARLFVTSTDVRLEDGRLESEHADVRFDARGTTDPASLGEASLVLTGARVGPFVDAVRCVTGRALEVPPGVPLDAGLEGSLSWDERRGGACTLQIATQGLSARIEGRVGADGGALEGRVEADVAPALPLRALRTPAALVPRDEDLLRLALDVRGDAKRPIVSGTIEARQIGFRFGRPRFCPVLALTDVHADVALADDVAQVRARARAGAATLEASLDLPLRTPAGRRVTGRVDALDAGWVVAIAGALGAGGSLSLEGDAAPSPGVFFVPRDARASAGVTYAHDGEVAHATVTVRAQTPRSAVSIEPLAIEDRRITGGRVHGALAVADALAIGLFPSDIRPRPEGEILVDVAVDGPLAAPVVRGRLASPRLDLEIASRPDVPPFPCFDVDARATATRDALRLDEIRFRAYGGSFRVAATIASKDPPAEPLVLRVKDADATFVEAVARLARGAPRVRTERAGARAPGEIWIARGARTSGTLVLRRGGRIDADVTLESPAGTALAATLAIGDGGALDGSFVRGSIAIADALVAAGVEGAFAPLPEGAAFVEIALAGRGDEVCAAGFALADRVALASRGVDAPVFEITHVAAPFRVDASRLAWRGLEARAYDGRLASSGVVGFGAPFVGLRAHAAAAGVALEAIPIDRGGRLLGEIVRGRLSVDLAIERAGEGPVTAHGRARVDAPSYPALALAAPSLRRYGLPAPDPRGAAAATAAIAGDARGWRLRDVFAAVPGCSARGDVVVRDDATLDGAFVVTLSEEYLASSALLVVPSVLAETLTLPVRIGGPLAAPAVDADLGTLLGRFVTENRVTDLVTDAAEGVVALFTGREPAAPPRRASAPPPPPAPPAPDLALATLLGPDAEWEPILERMRARARDATRA